jgi:anaerobic selenocysteine-containing dehydrogenase
MSENGKELTRRKFLKDAGILAGGTVVAGSFLLAGCKEEVEVTKTVENTVTKTVTDAPSKVTLEVLNPRGEVEPPAVCPYCQAGYPTGQKGSPLLER